MNLLASPQRLALKKERCLLFGRALRTLQNSIPHTLSLLFAEKTASPLWGGCERVEKVDTLPYGNAARTKITDFRTALPTLAVPKENNRLKREFSLTAAP